MKITSAATILDVAVKLFQEKGYRGTSMDDIARGAGLLKGSVYHHFPGKQAILAGAVQRVTEAIENQVLTVAYNREIPESERLHEMVDTITGYFVEHKVCVIAYLSLEVHPDLPETSNRIREFFHHWREAFATVLTDRYGEARAAQLAEDAITRMEGAVLWLHLFDDAGPLRRAAGGIKAWL